MNQSAPVPGFTQVYGNPTNTQNIDQPSGTQLNLQGTVNFCSATVLCGGGGSVPTVVALGSALVSSGISEPPVYQTKTAVDVRDAGIDQKYRPGYGKIYGVSIAPKGPVGVLPCWFWQWLGSYMQTSIRITFGFVNTVDGCVRDWKLDPGPFGTDRNLGTRCAGHCRS